MPCMQHCNRSRLEHLKAMPVSLPSRAGRTLPTALAAPVAEGMMLPAAARPPLQSFLEGPSTVFCVAVVACTVVISASLMPKESCSTCRLGLPLKTKTMFLGFPLFTHLIDSCAGGRCCLCSWCQVTEASQLIDSYAAVCKSRNDYRKGRKMLCDRSPGGGHSNNHNIRRCTSVGAFWWTLTGGDTRNEYITRCLVSGAWQLCQTADPHVHAAVYEPFQE